MTKKTFLSGFTLPELLIVLAILASIFGLSTINLLSAYHKNTLGTTVSTLISNLKHQQMKSMTGDNEGQTEADDYGIYFLSDRYILFKGSTYNASDPLNFTVNLNNDLQFSSILVPDSRIIFSRGNGEVANYNPSFDNITIHNTGSDENKTIRINQLGTIINIY